MSEMHARGMSILRPPTIIGLLLIATGLFGVILSVLPTDDSRSLTVPSGGDNLGYVKISTWMWGHVSGSYEVTSGADVIFLVFDSSTYNEFITHDLGKVTPEAMESMSIFYSQGETGSFSVDLRGASSYYLVVRSNSISGQIGSTVTIHYKVEGFNLHFLIGGVVALALGVVLAAVSVRKSKRKTAMPRTGRPETMALPSEDDRMSREERRNP